MAQAIEMQARARGFLLYLCNSNGDPKEEKSLVMSFMERQIRGMIVVPSAGDLTPFSALRAEGIPYIFLNRTFREDLGHCLREDNEGAAGEIVSYLLQKGRRHVAGLFLDFENMIYLERYNGMKKSEEKFGISWDESLILRNAGNGDFTSRFRNLFLQENAPDAIFASNDMLAFDAYRVLYELKERIPEDVMVIGFDDTQMAKKIYPQLSSYRMPIATIAESAIQCILEPGKPRQGIIVGELIKRMSTGD